MSKNYRGIALGSIFSKIFDNYIISSQCLVLNSDNLQFAYKSSCSRTQCVSVLWETIDYYLYNESDVYIDGHESKPANSNFSKKFLFDKFKGNTLLHNVLKNLVPSMSLYPSFRQLSKPAISHSDTFQQNKTG